MIPIRTQSTRVCPCAWHIGENFCCCTAAGIPKINKAIAAPMIASKTRIGEIPAIHIIVVVVSPRTLHAPPAFEAATIAAINPI
jgi:hypothetical protein